MIASRFTGTALALSFCLNLLAAPCALAAPKAKPAPKAAAPTPPAAPTLSETLTGMARAEYEAGKILYADGDFASASLKFQRSYEESKDPRLLWNQAAAEKKLRRYVRVAELVERYLVESGDKLSAEDRADAQALLDTVKTFIAEVTFKVVPDGAAIYVDDQPVATSPLFTPLRLEMGERRIKVSKAGFVEYSVARQFDGGAPATVEVSLQVEVHEGKLHVVAGARDTVRVDGAVVGTGVWQGTLKSGSHHVEVSAPGKQTYRTDVTVQDNQTSNLQIALDPVPASAAPAPARPTEEESGGGGTWLWVGGGLLLGAGLGVGAYFLFKKDDLQAEPVSGTLDPGVAELRF
jgi:hypothetical protein